ncbi:MAG: hypothetical protein IPL90_00915 [Holophagales bacterium]|nr:hypothetical protein [Holophagales bacterium]
MAEDRYRFRLLLAVVFAGLTAAWGAFLRPAHGEAPWPKAAFLGLLGTGTVLSFWSVRKIRSDARLIAEAARGIPPSDGERGAAVGELVPTTDERLTAPFSGEPALLYSYRVERYARVPTSSSASKGPSPASGPSRLVLHEGDAMVPCEIRTRIGPVKMLKPPTYGPSWNFMKGPEAAARAEAFLASTPFAEAVYPDTFYAVRETAEAGKRESLAATGTYRCDSRTTYGGVTFESPLDLGQCDLSEARFGPGDAVTLLGLYDAERGGFTSMPDDPLDGVTLLAGGVSESIQQTESIGCVLIGLGLVLVVIQVIVAW